MPLRYSLSLAGALLCAGCMSFTSFQTPEVMPTRGKSIGMGMAHTGVTFEGDLMARYGLFKNADAGAKLSFPLASISADLKYQLLRKPLLVAADVGLSYGRFCDMPDAGNDYDYLTLYPELLLGTSHVYTAVRATGEYEIEHVKYDHHTNVTARWLPQLFLGGSFGNRFRIQPELYLTVPWSGGKPDILPGIGLAFQYRP